jgi:NAD-dependent SIR2 family protein deacetylase
MRQYDFERAALAISRADSIVVAAGAGMGVDSGLPDFRGDEGFWRAYPALASAGINFQRAASALGFRDDPEQAWGFYGHRLALYRGIVPHLGFKMLQNWSESKPHGACVFTSNVDGQFQRAGFAAHQVHECHGSIHHLQCSQNCCGEIWSASSFQPQVDMDACRAIGSLPRCPACGAVARPNILMFDDWDWAEQRSEEQRQVQERWLAQVERPVVIEIGAGLAIPTVRHFSRRVAQRPRGTLIRINAREFDVEREQDIGLGTSALLALDAISTILAKV